MEFKVNCEVEMKMLKKIQATAKELGAIINEKMEENAKIFLNKPLKREDDYFYFLSCKCEVGYMRFRGIKIFKHRSGKLSIWAEHNEDCRFEEVKSFEEITMEEFRNAVDICFNYIEAVTNA